MRRVLSSLWIALLATGSVAEAGEADRIDPAWLEKAKTEGKACYDRYEALSARIEEKSETRFERLVGEAPAKTPFVAQVHRLWVVSSGGNMIVERTRFNDGDSKPQIVLKCENSRYSFALSKKQSDSPYLLVNYKPGRESVLANALDGLNTSAFEPLRQPLDAIDGKKGNSLKAIHWDESRKLLRIVSTFLIGGKDPSPLELWVDPYNNWRVVESRRETKSGWFITEVTYGQTIDGLSVPIASKSTSTYKPGINAPGMVITTRMESVRVADKTDRDFTLSAFGLPEPVDVEPLPDRTPRYLWFVLGAVVCAAGAVLFRYLARSRRGVPTVPEQGKVL